MMQKYNADVLIIGAGPAGALAALLLRQSGYSVHLFERMTFPRFSIGESLLPQSMHFLDKAGALADIIAAGFQEKDGAAFQFGQQHSKINFSEKFTQGWDKTYEVQRANFDQILANCAIKQGAKIHFEHTITSYTETEFGVELQGKNSRDELYSAHGKFVLDASGYGRVLPKLLNLDKPSDFPVRKAVFTHIEDRIVSSKFDRKKILITINSNDPDIWYWLIPFSNGTSSIGAVGRLDSIDKYGDTDEQRLTKLILADKHYQDIMPNPRYIRDVGSMVGYSSSVKSLFGHKFALLGNAGEFLDPVFSSGLTIAFKSADLAVEALCKQFKGEVVDWKTEYSDQLMVGVKAFKVFVEAWYDRTLQTVILNQPEEPNEIKRMITSVLAGYAWDMSNKFVTKGKTLLEIIAKESM